MSTSIDAFQFIVGWAVILTLLYGLTKIKAGKVILYYIGALLIVLLLVTHSQQINGLITATGLISPQQA